MILLERVVVLTHEDVICFWTMTSDLEQLHQIEELPMYITAYL
jgi:hypothetical protein